MKCLDARQLFPAHLDGELAPNEALAFEAHLAACTACAGEWRLEQALGTALRESVEPVAAPADFAQGVLAAIGAQRGVQPTESGGLFAGWRRGLAAAAALAVISTASLGYASLHLFNRLGPAVVQKPPEVNEPLPPTTPEPGMPVAPQGEPSGGADAPDVGESNAPDTGAGSTSNVAPAPNSGANTGKTTVTPPPRPERTNNTQIAAVPDREPAVFLNKPRSIESTLLNLKVNNVVQAREQAIRVAGEMGAGIYVQDVPSGGAQVEVLEINVDPAQAGTFTSRLASLGQVVHRQDDRMDITRQFEETLEDYQALIARRNRESNPQELAVLENLIASKEQQLLKWDRDAERYTVMLVLQQ